MLWLRRGRHLLGIIQPAVSKLIRHLLPWCSIKAGINGFGAWLGGCGVCFTNGLGGGEGWRAQSASKAQCWGEKAEAVCKPRQHEAQLTDSELCLRGCVQCKENCHFHGFQAKLWKYFYFHFLISIQLCIFFLYLISRVKLTFKCIKFISDVNGKPFPWSQTGPYGSIPD